MSGVEANALELGFDELPERLSSIRNEIRAEYVEPHKRAWILGFSGGKDSTLLLQLVFEVLLELPPSQRIRTIHVLSNDTLVESPIYQSFVNSALDHIREAALGLRLPISVVQTNPDLNGTFWVNLIGLGYPAPNRLFRWCTDRMKIRPTTQYIREQVSKSGEVLLLLGVRRSESSARAKVAKRYDNGGRLNKHNDIPGCLVFRPILELSTDEVWATLSITDPPWGGSQGTIRLTYQKSPHSLLSA